jgi:hypothetical protein
LDTFRELFNAKEYDAAFDCIPRIEKHGQQVLKEEWERVKQGEPAFRWSKRVLFVLLVALALGVILALWTRAPSNIATRPANTQPVNTGMEPYH